jgi:O-antigen/teichoic acid export membrane protein
MIGRIISKIRQSQITTYYIAKIVPAIFGYLFVFSAVKLFGLELYGKYSLFFSQIILLNILFIGYFNVGQMRYFSKISYPKYQSAKLITLCFAIIPIIIFPFLFPNYINELSRLIFFSFAFVFILYRIKLQYLQASLSSKEFLVNELSRSFLLVCLPVVFWFYISKSFVGLTIAIGLSFLISLLINVKLKKFTFNFKEGLGVLRMFFKYSWPISLFLFVTQGFQLTDKLFISHLLGENENGAYCSTFDIVYKSMTFLLFPIIMSEFPKMINRWNSDKKNEAKIILRRAIRLQLSISLIVFLISLFIAYDLLIFMLPEVVGYISYFDVLFMILSAIVWQFGLLFHKTLEFYEKTIPMFLFILVAWIVNVILIYLLIQKIGITIVPLSFLISSIIYNFLIFLYTKKIHAFS